MRWLKEHWLFSTLCFCFGLVGATLIVFALLRGPDESNSQPAPGPSASEASHQHSHEDETLDDGLEFEDQSCTSTLSTEEYSNFIDLVHRYENAFQSPPSEERLENLSALTTLEYQAGHEVTTDESSDTLVEVLWEKTSVTCEVIDGTSRLVSVRPTIQTSFINDSGDKEIIFAELTLHDVHYSTWVMDSGSWKVSQEF